jgi:hypothetical protein
MSQIEGVPGGPPWPGIADVRNMAHARVGDLFGQHSNSAVLTLMLDYRSWLAGS